MSIAKLTNDICQVTGSINSIKADFAAYIRDKDIPLEERWKFFEKAPNFIKEQDSYIHTFKWEQKHGELVWYDDFYCDRYQVVDMDMIIDSMLDRDEKYTKEMVEDMKEEILSENLGSFINDW